MIDRRKAGEASAGVLWADKALISSIPLFYVTLFLFYSWFPLNAAPVLLSLAIYFPYLLVGNGGVPPRHLGALLFLVLFSMWACIYLIIGRGGSAVASMIFVFFASLPLFFVAIARVHESGEEEFIAKVFLAFLVWQSLVVLWQIAGRLSGIGFDPVSRYGAEVPESYTLMLTGTYYNSNDLAATVGAIFAFFVLLKGRFPLLSNWGVILCVFLAVCTASRAVLLFMIVSTLYFAFSRSVLKAILIVIVGTCLSLLVFFGLTYYFQELGFVARILDRVFSIIRILTDGVYSDNSMSLRLVSYLQFLRNLDVLGWGSFKLKDYSIFLVSLGPRFELMSVNPHSFIVEVGYWLGWAGLTFWIFFMVMMASRNFGSVLYVLFSFFMLSMVSSSVFNNFMFIIVVFALFIFSKKKLSAGV